MRKILFIAAVFSVCAVAQVPAPVAECVNLKHKGDPGANACYMRLSNSNDLAMQAEGFWGLGNFRAANDAFRGAVKAHPDDPAPRVRWGRLFMEHWQPSEAKDLFDEAVKLKPDYAPALLGLALVQGEQFEGQATKNAEKALKADPKLYEAEELIARVQLEDNNPKKRRRRRTGRWPFRRRRWMRWLYWAASTY